MLVCNVYIQAADSLTENRAIWLVMVSVDPISILESCIVTLEMIQGHIDGKGAILLRNIFFVIVISGFEREKVC